MGCGTWTFTECNKGIHIVRSTARKPKFGYKGGEPKKQAAKKDITIKGVKLKKPSIFVVI
jgi:hypothetical protein